MRNVSTALILTAFISAGGCVNILGFEEVTALQESSDATAPAIDAAIPELDADTRFACAESAIDPALGTTIVNTETNDDALELSCATGGGSPEKLLSWIAPVRDYYVFDTEGSQFDTVLGLFDECEGTEIACNNNVGEGNSSKIVHKLAKDEEVLIAVDGFAGDQGEAALTIARVSCPDADISEQTLPLSLSTLGFGDDTSNSCGGQGQEDRGYHWVAPSDGLFAFKAVSENFAPIISVHEGPECGDEELGCSGSAGTGKRAEVVRRMTAGQEVSLYVDGIAGGGSFDLDITDRSDVTCPEAAEMPDPSDAISFTPRVMSGSCGSPVVFGEFGGSFAPGDMSYPLTLGSISEGCNGSCTATVESQGDFIVYILDQQDCGGTELACIQGELDPKTGSFVAELPMAMTQDAQNLTVVVQAQSIFATSFTVDLGCGLVC